MFLILCTCRLRSQWLWQVGLGYTMSVFIFFLSDLVSRKLLPSRFFVGNALVVSIVSTPHFGAARIIGLLAPCVTAPIWEELFYRGLILPWIASFASLPSAMLLTSVVFAAQHFRADSFLPLLCLGYFWTILYLLSRNLLVPIIVHALWNFRVIIGSKLL